MSILKKSTLAFVASSLLLTQVYAREQVRVVGSSTVYPFSSSVAEELGATTDFRTPVVESTGSGGGMKLFCAGNALNTPDITNASRRMKVKEFDSCMKNGVTNITEAIVGFDGIVFAQSKSNQGFTLTKKHLLLAVAADVPNRDNTKLIPNPYKKWSDIDSNLPNRDIIVYGPPKSSGTRDAFEDMVLKSQTKKMPIYIEAGFKKYHKIRRDGLYIPSGENDNLIVQKLQKNKKSFGIFGYSFLIENDNKIKASRIDGVLPNSKTISSGKYPISRSLFFYIKNSHRSKIASMNSYIEMFMSEDMIGEDGILGEIGLIPLPKNQRESVQKSVLNYTKLTKDALLSH